MSLSEKLNLFVTLIAFLMFVPFCIRLGWELAGAVWADVFDWREERRERDA